MKLHEIRIAEEDGEIDEAQFERDCAFYLEKMAHYANEAWMFRGTNSSRVKVGAKNPWRPRDRGPVDTPDYIHDELNEHFEEEFGKPFRNGMFVTADKVVAETYGEPYVVVPVGKFEWLSNPDFEDMYTFVQDVRVEHPNDEGEVMMAVAAAVRESRKWKHNRDLPGCVTSRAEVMLWPENGFYLFDPDELPRALRGRR